MRAGSPDNQPNLDRLARDVLIENAIAGYGNDVVIGNEAVNRLEGRCGRRYAVRRPGRGDDAMLGNAGNDHLFGGQGSDRLDGGTVADRIAQRKES